MADFALRSKANKALLEGNSSKALELFAELHEENPADLRTHLKLAELREKTGDTASAVTDYIRIAKKYADEGLVVQAIAIEKIIVRLDPSQTEIKEELKRLSVERGDDWALSVTPGSQPAAAAEGQPPPGLGLTRTPLLSGLAGDELEGFIESLELRSFSEGDFIFQKGDAADGLYLVGMGEVALEAQGVDGKTKVFSRLREGDFFGVDGFMSRTTQNHAARATRDATILLIDRATFDTWVEKHPNIRATAEDFYRQRVLARILAITPVFEGVPDDARMELSHSFTLKTFSPDEVVVQEGEAGDTFYLIRSGTVQVSTAKGQKKVVLGAMKVGDFFGEVALLSGKPRTATVISETDVELMELSRPDFNKICDKFPSIRATVEAYQKKRVQDTIKTLLNK